MFKLSRQQKDHRYFCGNRYEKYSIKKLKVGAASVLIGAGFLFGYNVDTVEADSATETVVTKDADMGLNQAQGNAQAGTISEPKVDSVAGKTELAEQPKTNEEKSVEPAKPVKENEKEAEQASAVSAHTNTAEATEAKPSVDLSLLQAKLADLEAQIERIRGNKKQASQIQNAEKLVAEAKQYLSALDATQSGADKKAKEVSSLTSVLKSIKAEETLKENKNQDSRNGKKMEEGTGFRNGVTDQALTGSIHFDNSNGPTEKQIPIANNGDGERVINMAITYSASSSETVTDGKVRVTIPKEFLHSTKKPEFANSTFVKSVDDLSTTTDYVYDLNLNPMSGGSVAESLLKLYVGTSIKNAPSNKDVLSVNTDFIAGGKTLSTKTARATFDYLSEILYREKDSRPKTVKYMVDQFGAPLPEFKMGFVSNGTFKPIEGSTFKLPFIMSDQSFFNNEETTQNGNGRLTSYDYTISGIPDFLELDPTNVKNNKFWTLENGVLTLHPDEKKGIDQSLLYGGPILKVKEGAFNTPEAIERVIESNSTKGFNANIVYKAVGHRPDGSTFIQILENPDGFRLYLGDGIPAIKEMDTGIYPETNQRLYSHASNEDKFNARYYIPFDKLKGDGAFLPSQYINYFIPKDQEGNYFTKFQLNRVYTNEIRADGSKGVRGYYREQLDGNLKENFKLYGVTKDNQAELLKEYTSINELYDTIEINPEKKYEHLILKHPGIVDEFQKYNSTSKTITGLESRLGVTVGTWKEKAQDKTIQRYDNKIAQGSTSENTIESAIAMERPATGSGDPAWHVKTPTKLSLDMNQIGSQTLTKDQLTRGQTIPIAVTYSAGDYFGLIETDKNGSKTYDLAKLDPNITKTSVMLLADPKLPLKDFRLAADNRLLSKYTLHFGGANGDAAKESYDKLKESYDTVNPTNIIENYKGTGKRAYIFDSKDLNLTSYDLNEWIKGGLYSPTALTFEVENNGQVEAGTYGIESYLVWNSESETLVGNDSSINANFVENHAPGLSISKANINVTINNVSEYSTSLTIAKPGTTGVRGIIDVKNGQEVILSPQIENLTDLPQRVKEAVVLIPKTEALTYLEGPIVDDSDEYDVVYTTSTATDKTTGTYVTADQITNWKDVTAVKYVFKNNYTITKEHAFKHHFNLRVDQNNPNYVQSNSQIFLKDGKDTWLESNVVGLRTEDVRGKLEVYYKTVDGELLKEFPKTRDFEGQPYTTTKEPILKGFVNRYYAVYDYIFIEVQPDSDPETGTYERQVTKKVTYLYDKANVKVETKDITRTINYIEKNNEGNIISNPVIQKVTVSRKVYTGEKTGRVVEDNWEIPANAKWESVASPTPSEWEKPEVKVNDQYIAKAAIDEVRITPEVLNNGNVVENVYYERFVPVGGDVVAKYVIEGTTTELKEATDVAKGLKVGKNYTSTAPVAGEELIATDGKVYVYKGHKATSAAETGTVTADKQEVVYEYAPKLGGNVEVKYVVAGTEENLKNPVELVTNGQIGSDYTATKDATITKEDGRVYKLVAANNGLKTGSARETGKVTTEKQTVTYEYELQKGNVTVNYTDVDGQPIEGKTSVVVENQSPTGKEYTTNTPELKPETITTESGKVYKLLPDQTVGKESGKVTVDPISVTYKYELQKGNVTVNYTDVDGQPIEGKTSVVVENQSPTGKEYTTNTPELKPETITTESGKVYKLVPDQTVGKETGKVTVDPISVTYKYELQKGDVTVKYEDEAGESIKPDNHLKSQVPTGDDYNTTTVKDLTITKDGKLYKLVEKNGGLKEGSSKENGKVSNTPTVVTYVYSEVKGEIIQKFVDESGKEIKDPTNTGKKSLNEKVNLEHPNRITDKDGKVYEFVKVDKVPTNFTEQLQTATYTYRVVKGQGVTVSYETTTGVPLKETQTVQPKDTQLGTDYDTTTSNFKPERIEKDGKVYILTATTKPGSAEEKGKVTEKAQNVTYVYEEVPEHETKQKYGNVIVTYVDKAGRPLSGTTGTGVKVDKSVIDTPASLVKTPYDTTDNKPETITTAEGKVYKFVKVTQHSDAENSDVKSRTSVITYVYELLNTTEELPEAHIGFVVVNYVDENGLPISGTSEGKEIPTTVMDVNGDLVGTQYDTTDHKPTTITNANGDVYEFVKKSETSDPESGELKEGVSTVEYVYRKVVTTYVDEAGKEINPSDKGTKDKKDIPEYIYKETKKDEKGNTIHVYRQVVTSYVDEAGKEINPSDKGTKDKKDIPEYIYKETKKDEKGNTTHVYRQVVTSYVNEEGKEITPSDKGTKDKKDIPEYIFKETKKDKDGNTIHVYTKKSSSTPETPKPSTPSNEESKSTVWKDTEGNVLKPQEDGTKDKGTFTGYEYVKTILVGNVTTHIFKKVITPSHDGTPSHPDVPGQSDTPAHSDVTVTSDKSTQIANSNESTFVDGKRELPNTGTQSSTSSLLLGALAAITGLGLVSRRRKDDKE